MAAVLPPTITEESTDASLIPIVTLDRTKAVGQIPIYSETTPSGTRTYQVPIDVYKSPRGITPQIAITYNSQQGLSCAGMGWSLSGLSVIARTNKSLYYDKTTDAVRMNNSDAFTLDGVRLIRLTSAGDSITYESETGKVKAVAHTIDNVISYFDVYWPDGRHGIFGYLGNAQNQLSYPVISLTDLWGNGVLFDYIKENNLYHISKISYGNASIAFNYMGMDVAVRASYGGGLQCMTSKLLQDITCRLGASKLKKYRLTYSEKNVKAVLTRIDLNAGGKSVNPLPFQYGTGTMSNTYNTTTSQLAEWYVSESPSSNGFSRTYTYDTFGRASGVHELFRDTWLHKDITYRNGKENTVQYTSQMGVLATENYKYNNGFFFEGWINGQTRIISSPVRNAFGQPTDVWTGDIQHHYGYTQFGYPVKYAAVGKQGRQYAVTTLHFNAATSNLTLRKDGIRDITERFVYDNLNRLVAYGKHQAEYASNGNLIRKSDVGEFLYNAKSNPYALTNNIRYNSVANDRMQEVDYYSFHRPMSVTENGYTFDFNYNDNFDRVQTTLLHDNKSVREKRFFCDRYEWVQDSTGIEERLYLFGDYYQSPAILVRKGGEIKLNYLLRDHLGSVTHVIDANGTVLQELSYDAWGQLRNPETHVTYRQGKAPEPLFERGYCGHEHLEPFGLVNMNARLYDSVLGRFLSPDPFVQQKDNSQNYNSYSYCMNNPLKYVDKSGKLFGFSLLWGLLETVYNVATHGLAFKHYSYRNTVNAVRIDMGMFKGSLGQVLNKWTWGAANSFVGNTIAHALNVAGQVDGVTHMAGMLALSGTTQGEAAFTIGHYSFGPLGYQADWRDHLFVHEYGHYIQSQQLGGAYFQIVAIPSLISASGMFGEGNHKYRWYEVNASKLGAEYFDEKYGTGAGGYQTDSPDYFDKNAFHDGGTTPYTNPRTGKRSQREHPITGIRHSAWDFLLPIALPIIIPTAWLTIEPVARPILQPFLFF